MLLTEYNEAETMQMFKEEGIKEGYESGTESSIRKMMKNLKMTLEQAMDALEIPMSERAAYISKLQH